MRTSLAALVVSSFALGVLHCGSTEGTTDADAGGKGPSTGVDGGVGGAVGQDGGTPEAVDGGAGPSSLDGADGAPAGPEGGAAQQKTIGFFVGVNALITDSVANLAPIGVVREYHNWGWLGNNYSDQAYPQTRSTLPTSPTFSGTGTGSSPA